MMLKQIYKKIKSHWFLIGCLLVYTIIIQFNFFSIPRITYDEPIYSYTGFHFLKTGSFFHTFNQFSGKEFCLHPFFLSIFFTLFGTSFEVARLLSFCCGILSLTFVYFYCKQLKLSYLLMTLSLSLFVCANTLFVSVRIIRPECLLTLGFSGMVLMFGTCIQNNKKPTLIKHFFLGFFISIMCASHLIGVIFCLPIMFYLFYFFIRKKRYHQLCLFVCGGVPIFSLLCFNFFDQIMNDHLLTRLSSSGKIVPSFDTFQTNFNTYFVNNYVMGFKRLYIVFFEFSSIILGFIMARKNRLLRLFNISFLIFLLTGWVSISNFLRPYYVLLTLICLINCSYLFSLTFSKKKIFVGSFVLFLINQLAGNIYILKQNINNHHFSEIKEHFKGDLTDKVTVGGEKLFWFIKPTLNWKTNLDTNTLSKPIVWFRTAKNPHHHSSLSAKKSYIAQDQHYHMSQFSISSNASLILLNSLETTNHGTIELWSIQP